MEIEQRSVEISLHHNRMKFPEIVAELPSVHHEEGFNENRVKYWFHELKLHRSALSDWPSSGRPP
jgi:hypothetical protein